MPHVFISNYFSDHLAFVVVTLINAFAILVRKMFSLSPVISTFAQYIQIHHDNNLKSSGKFSAKRKVHTVLLI